RRIAAQLPPMPSTSGWPGPSDGRPSRSRPPMDDFIKVLITTATTLVVAIIGGLMVMAGRFIQDRRRAIEEKKKRKAEKLEEFASKLYDHNYWLTQLTSKVFEGERELQSLITKLPAAPHATLEAISIIYFPTFREHVIELKMASVTYINFILPDPQQKYKD